MQGQCEDGYTLECATPSAAPSARRKRGLKTSIKEGGMFDRAHLAAPDGLLCRGRLERKYTIFPAWSVISDPVHFPGKSGDISDISVISVPPRWVSFIL